MCVPASQAGSKEGAGLLPGYNTPQDPLGHHPDGAVVHLSKGCGHLAVHGQQCLLPALDAALHCRTPLCLQSLLIFGACPLVGGGGGGITLGLCFPPWGLHGLHSLAAAWIALGDKTGNEEVKGGVNGGVEEGGGCGGGGGGGAHDGGSCVPMQS